MWVWAIQTLSNYQGKAEEEEEEVEEDLKCAIQETAVKKLAAHSLTQEILDNSSSNNNLFKTFTNLPISSNSSNKKLLIMEVVEEVLNQESVLNSIRTSAHMPIANSSILYLTLK